MPEVRQASQDERVGAAKRASPWPAAALAALALVAPLVVLRGHYDAANLPQSALIQVAALVLLAGALWTGAPLSRAVRAPWTTPLVALLAWAALSMAWARDVPVSARAFAHFAACGLIACLAAGLCRLRRDGRRVLAALFLAGVVASALGLAQQLAGWSALPQAAAPAATFVNKNVAASFVVLTLPLALALAPAGAGAARPKLVAAGLGAGAGLMAGYVLATLTRSAWLAVLVQAGAAILWYARPRGRAPAVAPAPATGARGHGRAAALATAVACVAVAVALGPGFWRAATARVSAAPPAGVPSAEALASAAPGEIAGLGVTARLAIWANTLVMLRDHALAGVGLAQHPIVYPRYARAARVDPFFGERWQLDFAHNDALQFAAELGLVGLALGAWLAWAGVRALRALARGDGEQRALALVAALAGLGLAVDATFNFPLQRALPPFVLAVVAGLATAWSRTDGGVESAPRAGHKLAAAVVFLGAAIWAGLLVDRLRADRLVGRALLAERRGDWGSAATLAGRALRFDSSSREAQFVAGSAALGLGRPAEARAPLEALVRARPHHATALGNLGEAYAATGDLARALDATRALAVLLPDDAQAQLRLGVLEERAGRRTEALAAYRRAADLRPGDARLRFRYGVAALRAGAHAQALAAFEQAMRLDPGYAAAHRALGVLLYERLGRREEGAAHLEKALALDPSVADAARMRGLVDAVRSPASR